MTSREPQLKRDEIAVRMVLEIPDGKGVDFTGAGMKTIKFKRNVAKASERLLF